MTSLADLVDAQWPTIENFYRADGDALMILDDLRHGGVPTPFKFALVEAALS